MSAFNAGIARGAVLAACALVICGASAQHGTYPERAVRLVVPAPAGTPVDLLARVIANDLSARWGKPVIVENIVGASGSIGVGAVVRAEPDGHVLLLATEIPLTMYPAVAKRLPYDPRKDLKPLALLGYSASALFVHARLAIDDVDALVAAARRNPSGVLYSSSGVASPAHFAAEWFASLAAIELTHVPYSGSLTAMAAVASGEVAFMIGPVAQGLALARAGKIRALGVATPRPSPMLPGVLPLADQGLAGFSIQTWYAMLAPAQTSEHIARLIEADLKHSHDDPDIAQRMLAAGITPSWNGPLGVSRAIDADLTRWRALAQRLGIEAMH